jgi:cytochrome c oxidase assembly protein subunit 11
MRRLSNNHRLVIGSLGLLAAAAALTAIAVPLYSAYFRATGLDGTPRVAHSGPTAFSDQTIEVRFDTNVMPHLPWVFSADERSVVVHLGQSRHVHFHVHNRSTADTAATVAFNVTPDKTGPYFTQVHCFCFDRQELAAQQSADLDLTFFVDPAIATNPQTRELPTITLSYTFYPTKPAATPR